MYAQPTIATKVVVSTHDGEPDETTTVTTTVHPTPVKFTEATYISTVTFYDTEYYTPISSNNSFSKHVLGDIVGDNIVFHHQTRMSNPIYARKYAIGHSGVIVNLSIPTTTMNVDIFISDLICNLKLGDNKLTGTVKHVPLALEETADITIGIIKSNGNRYVDYVEYSIPLATMNEWYRITSTFYRQ